MTAWLEAETGHIETSFPFFIMKQAPVSGVESLMDYGATLIGEHNRGHTEIWLRVVVRSPACAPLEEDLRVRRPYPVLAYHYSARLRSDCGSRS